MELNALTAMLVPIFAWLSAFSRRRCAQRGLSVLMLRSPKPETAKRTAELLGCIRAGFPGAAEEEDMRGRDGR